MLTRREVLKGGVAVGVAGFVGRAHVASAVAPMPRTKVAFDVPAGACDCHVHVFGDPQKYPFIATRAYTPEVASVEELQRMLAALRLDRVVIVQPSVYGTDNSCTLDGMRQLGARARGVAVIDEKISDADLDAMGKVGIRGIRINLATAGITDPNIARQRFDAAVARVRARKNWHVQINTQPSIIAALADQLLASPVPLVIDHFGGAVASAGMQQPGFPELVRLAKSGKAYVKISGSADSLSKKEDLSDAAPFVQALVAANPQRIIWGTNWPHPSSTPPAGRKPTDLAVPIPIDDGKVMSMLATWVPDAATRKLILVDNPARLYEF